jgi:hypothetical protein
MPQGLSEAARKERRKRCFSMMCSIGSSVLAIHLSLAIGSTPFALPGSRSRSSRTAQTWNGWLRKLHASANSFLNQRCKPRPQNQPLFTTQHSILLHLVSGLWHESTKHNAQAQPSHKHQGSFTTALSTYYTLAERLHCKLSQLPAESVSRRGVGPAPRIGAESPKFSTNL